MDRIEAWNHIIEELDAKTLEKADGLSVNELLEMIHKNYRDSYDNFVEEHKNDPPPYEDKWEDFQTEDASLGEVYDEDRKNLVNVVNNKTMYAAFDTIAESLADLMQLNLAKSKVFLDLVKDVVTDNNGRVFFNIAGKSYFIKVQKGRFDEK